MTWNYLRENARLSNDCCLAILAIVFTAWFLADPVTIQRRQHFTTQADRDLSASAGLHQYIRVFKAVKFVAEENGRIPILTFNLFVIPYCPSSATALKPYAKMELLWKTTSCLPIWQLSFKSIWSSVVGICIRLCMISAKSFVSKTTNKDNIRKCYYSINCCLHVLLGQHGKWRNSCWSLLFWPSSHTWRVSWPIQTTTWWSGGQILDASDATWKKAVRYVHNCLVPPMCPCSKWKQCGEMLYCSYVK